MSLNLKLVTELGDVEKTMNVVHCKKNMFKDDKGVEKISYAVKVLLNVEMTTFEDNQKKSLGFASVPADINSEVEIPIGNQKVIIRFSEYKDKNKETSLSRKIVGLASPTTKKTA